MLIRKINSGMEGRAFLPSHVPATTGGRSEAGEEPSINFIRTGILGGGGRGGAAKWQPVNAFRQWLQIKALTCYCSLEPPCVPTAGTGAYTLFVACCFSQCEDSLNTRGRNTVYTLSGDCSSRCWSGGENTGSCVFRQRKSNCSHTLHQTQYTFIH